MIALGLAVSLGIGLACGAVNGALVVGLGVHPFIITLGTDVDCPRDCVCQQQRGEHPPAARVDERGQGVARAERCALSGADARDGGSCRGGGYLSTAHGRGPARLCGRRKPRGQPVFRSADRPREDRGVRALGADGGARGRSWAPVSTGRRRAPTRPATSFTSSPRPLSAAQACRAARAVPPVALLGAVLIWSSDSRSGPCTSIRTTSGSSSDARLSSRWCSIRRQRRFTVKRLAG